MKFSLVICTYMRPKAVIKLLNSVQDQVLYPDEILIIDGSENSETGMALSTKNYNNLIYYRVKEEDRGLTRQRNFGILKVNSDSEIVCFLDDDTVLDKYYFKEIIKSFEDRNVIGVGGVAVNENRWKKAESISFNKFHYYTIDGFVIKEGIRNVVRNYVGLQSPLKPGRMPDFSHVRTNGYPLNDKQYEVDLLIGMSFNFRKEVFNHIKFSTYFEGYGLYEDADFSLRALLYGKNIINTAAKLNHYHDDSGRPNKFNYGKMVVRNGWYVWRVKYPNPSFKAKVKWNSTSLLLTVIRFINVINTNKKREAFTEGIGRVIGWFSLIINKPKVER